MYDCYFIDKDGKKIYNEKILSHIGLAQEFLDKNETLKKEFEKSRIKDPSDFLIRKGYVKVASQGSYKKCVYISNGISEVQKELIKYFIKAGYEIENATVIDMIYDREDEER